MSEKIEAKENIGSFPKVVTCPLNEKEISIRTGESVGGIKNIKECLATCPLARKRGELALIINNRVVKCTSGGSLLRYGNEEIATDENNLYDD